MHPPSYYREQAEHARRIARLMHQSEIKRHVAAEAPSNCRIRSAEFGSLAIGSILSPTDTADFGPDFEFLRPGSSVLGGSGMIAAEIGRVC
jgi:hypothetical protein